MDLDGFDRSHQESLEYFGTSSSAQYGVAQSRSESQRTTNCGVIAEQKYNVVYISSSCMVKLRRQAMAVIEQYSYNTMSFHI